MMFKPTPSGGRVASGHTPFGSYRVEWDAAGGLIGHDIDTRTPEQPATRPSKASPGQLLKSAIAKITGEQPSECGCNKRAKQMDDNGWWWCWKNRRTIAGWLVESAKARPQKIRKQAQQLREQADALDAKAADAEQVAKSLDADRATTLLIAAWKELVRQNTNARQQPPTEHDHGT